MLQNIYSPLSGALAQEKVLDIIANNLANMNTVGFKEERVTFKLLESEPEKHYKDPIPPANYKIDLEEIFPLKGNELNYVGVSGVTRDETQGSPIHTKNKLDAMIEGPGYFSIQTKEGQRFTRNGSFELSGEGLLIDWQGNPVLGQRGDIYLKGQKVEINNLGEIYENGKYIDQLLIQNSTNTKSFEKIGDSQYAYTGNRKELDTVNSPTVKQGFLESSNVNAIKNMTNMILAHRSYEAYQKAIKNMDAMMEKSSNVLGRLAG